MNADAGAACDGEFPKLLARRDDVDLFGVAVEISRDVDPDFDAAACLSWIDARAAEIRSDVAVAGDERRAIGVLVASLAGRHGLRGCREAFLSADGSLPHRVIATGRGIPLGLSLIYRAVASRVGLELDAIAAPLHFLLGCEAADGPLFLDAFGGGRVLSRRECLAWLTEISGMTPAAVSPALRRADDRVVVTRMLHNVKAAVVRDELWHAAYSVQHRLVALAPGDFGERRDLAAFAVKAGRSGEAIDLIECCLKSSPPGERAVLRGLLADARSDLCRWN